MRRQSIELRRNDWNAKAESWYAEIRKGRDEQGSNRYGKGTVEIGGALSEKRDGGEADMRKAPP